MCLLTVLFVVTAITLDGAHKERVWDGQTAENTEDLLITTHTLAVRQVRMLLEFYPLIYDIPFITKMLVYICAAEQQLPVASAISLQFIIIVMTTVVVTY